MARGSWAESRVVTKQAWGVIKQNPYMLLFPVVSAVLAIIAVLVIGGAGVAALGWRGVEETAASGEVSTSTAIVGIVILIIAAYVATLITQVFMGGLVKCADEELQGRDSSFGAGLGAAMGRFPALMGWAGDPDCRGVAAVRRARQRQ